ncbi:MAG: hypothetical protein OEY63_03515 [Gemmatimonadota bacterium]|nr:hypothetical protein [Gemmatimonadota bacterium]MDH5803556.1 hypothetical protein [Gemmatimonadota bacterium]
MASASRGGAAKNVPGRTATIAAVGFLCLDGVLLVMVGVWAQRFSLLAWGIAFCLAALGVYVWWLRHVRNLNDLHKGVEQQLRELLADLPEPPQS